MPAIAMTSAVRHAAPQQSASGSKPWSQPISAPSHASASEMSMPPMSIRQGRFDQMTVAPQPGQLKAFRNKPRHLKLCTTSVRRKLHPQLGHNFAKMLIRYLSANGPHQRPRSTDAMRKHSVAAGSAACGGSPIQFFGVITAPLTQTGPLSV